MTAPSFGEALVWLADQDPDRTAVRCGDRVLTRRELDRASAAVASAWVADALAVDDVVAVDLPPGVDFVVACAAAWRAGATVLPLRLPPGPERDAVLALAAPALVVDRLPYGRGTAAAPPDAAASSWKLTPSSGSTGPPKLVRSTAPARIDPTAPVAAFVPRDAVQLVAAPIAHAASFVYAMRGLLSGHELVVMRDFEPGEWLRLVARYGVTWTPVNPHLMRLIWRHPDRAAADVSSLDQVLHLGSRCPADLKRAWLDWLGPDRVVEVYAGSESQGVACIGGREWLDHPGSVGRGVGDTEFRVVDADGAWCAPGAVGEIVMRRPGTAYAYLDAEAEVRTIGGEPGWHTLGDAGHLDGAGYLYVGDRLADLIATPAGPVPPSDIEAVLDAHPAIRSSAVVERDGRVHAVVDGDVGADGLAELTTWVADRLPAHQRPATWQVTRAPVRDPAGKVRRSAYR